MGEVRFTNRGEGLDHDVEHAVLLRAAGEFLDLPVRHLDGVWRQEYGVRLVDETSAKERTMVRSHELGPAVADRREDWAKSDDLGRECEPREAQEVGIHVPASRTPCYVCTVGCRWTHPYEPRSCRSGEGRCVSWERCVWKRSRA